MDTTLITNRHRTANTKFVVTRWLIPNGADYHNATVKAVFFDDEDEAKAYAKEWSMPPEMADLIPIATYDKIIADTSKSYAAYKQRFLQDFGEHDAPTLPGKRV